MAGRYRATGTSRASSRIQFVTRWSSVASGSTSPLIMTNRWPSGLTS